MAIDVHLVPTLKVLFSTLCAHKYQHTSDILNRTIERYIILMYSQHIWVTYFL